MVQRLLLANDLPGVGKVALATSIPIAAACQVETILLPTVLLSSHTGGFPDVVVEDMTDLNRAYFEQWKNLNLELAGILSGYCRNPQQLSQLAMYAKQTETPLIVDPVMGDGGKLYTGFTSMSKKYPANFFGTGDILSTLLAVATIQQINLHQAIPLALDFIDMSLERTLALNRDLKFGIFFEPFLAELQQAFQTLKEKL
ncbi:pyridoxamine kinase [Streptococcus suis]